MGCKSPPQFQPPKGYREYDRYDTWRGAWQAHANMADKYTARIITSEDLKDSILFIRKRPQRKKK